jgi:hypothetical protein
MQIYECFATIFHHHLFLFFFLRDLYEQNKPDTRFACARLLKFEVSQDITKKSSDEPESAPYMYEEKTFLTLTMG